MVIYNLIRQIQYRVLGLSGIFYGLHSITKDVIILKTYLAPAFDMLADALQHLANFIDDLAAAWWMFFSKLENVTQSNTLIDDIVYYADILISIARDPGYFVRSAIREFIPVLKQFIDNPQGYIISVFKSFTGFDDAFVFNPRGVVQEIIYNILGAGIAIINNPFGFVLDVIGQRYPAIGEVLDNPSGYVQGVISNYFPLMVEFLSNPSSFILDTIANSSQTILEKYAGRLMDFIGDLINDNF